MRWEYFAFEIDSGAFHSSLGVHEVKYSNRLLKLFLKAVSIKNPNLENFNFNINQFEMSSSHQAEQGEHKKFPQLSFFYLTN